MEFKYLNKTYEKTIRSKNGREDIGDLYFIKFLSKNPDGEIILLEDNPVPECLLGIKPLEQGWKEIPTCSTIESLK